LNLKGEQSMKELVLNMGDKFLSIIAGVIYVIIIISGIGTMSQSFMLGLVTLISGIVGNTLLFYFIYNLIDIRDNIRVLNSQSN